MPKLVRLSVLLLDSWHVPLRELLLRIVLFLCWFTFLDVHRLLHGLWQFTDTLPNYELWLRLTLSLRHVVRVLTLMMILGLARVLIHLLLHVLVCHLLLRLHLLFHSLSIKLLLNVLIRRWLELLLLLLDVQIVVDTDCTVRTLIHLITWVDLILLRIEKFHTCCLWLLLLSNLLLMLLLHLLLLFSLLLNLWWNHHVLEI